MTDVVERQETPPHLEYRVHTADGRTLAVAEWGDPDGIALFAFHGTPGGRIACWSDPSIYARHGLRRITVDRPGYGESTRLAGRSVADIVPDVIAIADELRVEAFAVTGGSGAGRMRWPSRRSSATAFFAVWRMCRSPRTAPTASTGRTGQPG